MIYYLKNKDNPIKAINCKDAREALSIAQERNRKDRRSNWKVYTEHGELVTHWIIHGEEKISY